MGYKMTLSSQYSFASTYNLDFNINCCITDHFDRNMRLLYCSVWSFIDLVEDVFTTVLGKQFCLLPDR